MNNWSQDLLDGFKKEVADMICVIALPQTSPEPVLLRFFTSKDEPTDLEALKIYALDSLRNFQQNNRGEQSIVVNFDKVYTELMIVCQGLTFIFISKKTMLNEVLLNKLCHEFCQQIAPSLQEPKTNSLHEFKPTPTQPKVMTPAAPLPLTEAKNGVVILREQANICVKQQEDPALIQHWLDKKALGKHAKKAALQTRQQALAKIGSYFVSSRFEFTSKQLKIERAYIKGRNMVEIVESRQKMTLPQGLAIIRKLVDILSPVHKKNLAHGNINPYNVFFSPDREVLLTDDHLFDLIASDNFIRKSYSQVDRLPLGHLGYLAPEQLLGEAATPQSDFWALGYLLCYLLLGEPVLRFNTPSEQIVASHNAIKEAIKTRILTLYPALEALLSGLLHEKPKERFADLNAILKGIMQVMQTHQNADSTLP